MKIENRKKLGDVLKEYKEKNTDNKYKPVAVGRYGIRKREEIYSKELAKDYSKNKLIYKNTLTVGMGSKQIDIGILTENAIYAVSPAYHTFRINNIDANYLRYCLDARNADMSERFMIASARQGKSVDFKKMLEYEIPVYSESDTQTILFNLSKIEEVILNLDSQLEKMDLLVKSRFIEMFGDPVENEKKLEVVPLSELAEIKIGPFGSLLHKEDYVEGGHPLVNPTHIVDGKVVIDEQLTVSETKYEELKAYWLKKDDVVMGRRGEMGRCAVVTENGLLCGTGSLYIRSYGEVSADYIQKTISHPSFKMRIEDMAVGQTMQNLNVPIVSGFQIPKPTKEQQAKYYKIVDQIDKSKLAVQEMKNKMKILKASVMQEYFC